MKEDVKELAGVAAHRLALSLMGELDTYLGEFGYTAEVQGAFKKGLHLHGSQAQRSFLSEMKHMIHEEICALSVLANFSGHVQNAGVRVGP